MSRLPELKIGIGAALTLALVLFVAFPGCGGEEDTAVRARNLTTGEIQTFASQGDVPSDWVVCQSVDCPVPPSVPCQDLSETVCTLNPECRLKEIWCEGTVSVDADGNTTTSPDTKCEYECIPKLPLLCEELTDQQQCLVRPDCDWGAFNCPMICMDDGKGGCLPCPSGCYTKAPPICQSLTDEKACTARSDCEWDMAVCPAICQDDGKGGCLPCPATGTCRPKTPVPPPCPPVASPPPGFCPNGTIVYDKDANGCVTGYHCEAPQGCWDLNTAYINAVKKAKACNPYVMTPMNQCAKQVNTALFCPICPTFINPANSAAVQEMTDLEQKWLALKCDQMELACPAIACEPSKSATCLPGGAGSASGSCVDDQPTP